MNLQAIDSFSSNRTSYAQEYCASSLMCNRRSCLLSFLYLPDCSINNTPSVDHISIKQDSPSEWTILAILASKIRCRYAGIYINCGTAIQLVTRRSL